jgi:hypothetical protein
MNNLLIIIFALSLSSCVKEREASAILKFVVNNESQKLIVFAVTSDIGYKEINIKSNNLGEIEFHKTITKKDDGGWTIYGGDGDPNNAIVSVDFIDNCIYNISDTTCYCFEAGQPISEKIDSIYLNNTNVEISGTAWNLIECYNVVIPDTLLTNMKKDYSLLEKFSEYYSNK